MFSFSPPPGGTKIGCCIVFSSVSVSIQVISFRLLVVELFSCLIAAEVLTSLKNLRHAAPNFHTRRRLTRESPPPVQQTQSVFHLHAQRNASRRRDVRQQSDNVSNRYRSVNKFHTAKPTHPRLS